MMNSLKIEVFNRAQRSTIQSNNFENAVSIRIVNASINPYQAEWITRIA